MIPFQWSDHILNADGGVIHREFLHADRTDPRRSFAEKLIETVRAKGSIVVYGSFEATRTGGFDRVRPRLSASIGSHSADGSSTCCH